MNCSRTQSLLSAYMDRELTGVEMFLVRQHVHDCDECRREEEEVRHIKSLLSAAPVVEPSPDFEVRLVGAVMGTALEPAEQRRLRNATVIAATSLAAAAAVCLFYIVHAAPEPTRSTGLTMSRSGKLPMPAGATMAVSMQRDSAFIHSADPLSGPQGAVAASYAAP